MTDRPFHVAVVEDDADMLDLLELMFRELARWQVSAFRSGATFLEAAERLSPLDLLLVDHRMEPVTGPQVLSALAARHLRGCPAVYLSGMRPSEEDLRLADGFVMKPFTFDELMIALQRYLPPGTPA
jgi:CheY-like chemotaxis protein